MTTASRATVLLARASALFTLLTVSLGSVVCATKSGFDCHAWPGCYTDRFAPGPADIPAVLAANPALEMIHRVTAMTTGALLIATAIVLLRRPRPARWVTIVALVAVAVAGGSALFGRASVLGLGVDATGAAIDLLCALAAMVLSLTVAVQVSRGGRPTLGPASSPALLATTLLVVMHVMGQWAAGNRSFTRCMSWPILWLASDDNVAVQGVRTVIAISAAVTLVVAIKAALRHPALRVHAAVVGVLLAAVVVLAVVYRATGTEGGVLGVTFALASVGLLWTTALLAARSGLRSGAPVEVAPRTPQTTLA